uniref:Uncharacterized protein n=1 Tax=Romanomermis culicivorax TaxID=13658 RepID=A0A915I5M2_ROMCU
LIDTAVIQRPATVTTVDQDLNRYAENTNLLTNELPMDFRIHGTLTLSDYKTKYKYRNYSNKWLAVYYFLGSIWCAVY